jgi:hypothetical protein
MHFDGKSNMYGKSFHLVRRPYATSTCMGVRVVKITGYRLDDCMYWHFAYNLSYLLSIQRYH